MVGDEAEARANLSWGPDTLAAMVDSLSNPCGELSPDDMVGDAAGARANLSWGPDTLAGMAKLRSHELFLGETTTRRLSARRASSGIFEAGTQRTRICHSPQIG